MKLGLYLRIALIGLIVLVCIFVGRSVWLSSLEQSEQDQYLQELYNTQAEIMKNKKENKDKGFAIYKQIEELTDLYNQAQELDEQLTKQNDQIYSKIVEYVNTNSTDKRLQDLKLSDFGEGQRKTPSTSLPDLTETGNSSDQLTGLSTTQELQMSQ